MTPRAFACLALIAALAACGKKSEATTGAAPTVVAEAAAVDQYGSFDVSINGLAFWAHPTLPYNGLVIAATDNGVVAFNIEDGAEVARVDGVQASGISVSYAGDGPSAQGYAAISDAGADNGAASIGLLAIDNVSRQLVSLSSQFIATGKDDRGFCLGRDETGKDLVVYRMRTDGWSLRTLGLGGGASAEEKFAKRRGGFVACVADDVDRSVFAVNAAGDVYRIGADASIGKKAFAKTGVKNPAGIGLSLSGFVAGGPTDECCGALYVVDGADATVHVIDHDDGRSIGVIRLKDSFDVKGVASATAIGVGTGNFGGVYRDGVLALATDGDAPSIRLTPLNAVMNALSEPLGPPADLRTLGAQEEEEDKPGLDIDVPNPLNP